MKMKKEEDVNKAIESVNKKLKGNIKAIFYI